MPVRLASLSARWHLSVIVHLSVTNISSVVFCIQGRLLAQIIVTLIKCVFNLTLYSAWCVVLVETICVCLVHICPVWWVSGEGVHYVLRICTLFSEGVHSVWLSGEGVHSVWRGCALCLVRGCTV